MNADFQKEIESAFAREASLDEIVSILRLYRGQGMPAESAATVLEAMRLNADPLIEDRVLEILDIVTGFCRPELRVWDEA